MARYRDFCVIAITAITAITTRVRTCKSALQPVRGMIHFSEKGAGVMSAGFWLTEAQLSRLKPYFPKPRGKPRVDDRTVLSGIIYIQRNGLMWSEG